MRETFVPSVDAGDLCEHGNAPSTCPECAAKKEAVPLFDAEKVRAAVAAERFVPGPLVEAFKEDPELKRRYEADAGVWEKYSIERHTLMAMVQYERYLSGHSLPAGMDRGLFRTMLALHDIGKPDAVREGNIGLQHERTIALIGPALKKLGYQDKDVRLVDSLLGGDPIGRFLKTGKDPERWARQIVDAAEKADVDPAAYFALLLTFFKADASAYTRDAGGQPSLDRMFVFDREAKDMAFSEDVDDRVAELADAVESEASSRGQH